MQLLARRPVKVVMVALANKMARIAWAVLMRGETYRPPVIVPVIAVSNAHAAPARGLAMGLAMEREELAAAGLPLPNALQG